MFGPGMGKLLPTCNIRIPRSPVKDVDPTLEKLLGHVWKTRYIGHRDKKKTLRVVRSLESAYYALAVRFKFEESLDELGLGTVPWTTAIEVLASTGNQNVGPRDCIELLGKAPRPDGPELRHRRFWIKTKSGRCHMTFTQRCYRRLHDVRSKFVHGDKVSKGLLWPHGMEKPPLLNLASTVYRICLLYTSPSPRDRTRSRMPSSA